MDLASCNLKLSALREPWCVLPHESPFQFQKRSQLFIRTRNEPVSVVAMCICNADRSPVGINR